MSLKLKINNEIVLMRKIIRKARVHVIHKLNKEIKTLRDRKGPPEQLQKNKNKADRYVEEIFVLKKCKEDDISKRALIETKTPEEILNNIKSSVLDRVFAKMIKHKDVSKCVENIKNKYPVPLEKFVQLSTKKSLKKKKPKKQKESKDAHIDKNKSEMKLETKQEKQTNNSIIEKSQENEQNKTKIEKNIDQSNKQTEIKQFSKINDEMDNKSNNNSISTKTEENELNKNGKNRKFGRKINQSNKQSEFKKFSEINDKIENKSNNNSKNTEIEENEFNINSKKRKFDKKIIQLKKQSEVKLFSEVIKSNTDSNNFSEGETYEETMETKGVDPFFIADDCNTFLGVVIKTDTDGTTKKEKQNIVYNDNLNRKQRRQQMFRKTSKNPSWKNDTFKSKNNFNKVSFIDKIDNKKTTSSNSNTKLDLENLHPSWEAKKKQKLQIIPFEGKKIVFDD